MVKASNCEKCLDFDRKTKELVDQLFSREEATMILCLLAGTVTHRSKQLAKFGFKMKGFDRLRERRDIDMMNQSMGKFLISFDETYRRDLQASLAEKEISIRISHEACPHGEKQEDSHAAEATRIGGEP